MNLGLGERSTVDQETELPLDDKIVNEKMETRLQTCKVWEHRNMNFFNTVFNENLY